MVDYTLNKRYELLFEFGLIFSLIVLFLYIIKAFLFTIFISSIFVFFSYRTYEKLVKKTHSKTIPALFLLFIVLTLIIVPLFFITTILIKETHTLINMTSNSIFTNGIFDTNNPYIKKILENLNFLNININEQISKLMNKLSLSLFDIFNSISSLIINIFIFILSYYYLLKDGDKFIIYVKKLLPIKEEFKDKLFKKFQIISEAIFLNVLLVAFIQGMLVGFGFWIFGIPSPLIWGLVASFFALLPFIGTGFVWIPGVLYLFFIKEYYYAFGLLIYSLTIVSFSDNIIRPYLLKKKIDVHPFLILITVLGGIKLFGFFGIFIGPLIISLLISVIDIYHLNFKSTK